MQIAQAGLDQAQETHQLTQIELQRADHDLAQRTLRSPTTGVVAEQFIVPGEFIYNKPIMRIAVLNPLRIEVVLPAELFGSIQVGDEAIISPELDLDDPLYATVDTVDALLDTRSATFGVRLTLPNDELAVISGQKRLTDRAWPSHQGNVEQEAQSFY